MNQLTQNIIAFFDSTLVFNFRGKSVGWFYSTSTKDNLTLVTLTKDMFRKGYGEVNIAIFDAGTETEITIDINLAGDETRVFEGFLSSMNDLVVILRCTGVEGCKPM
jgi:hypothetical protein